jgi:hypothetical protein
MRQDDNFKPQVYFYSRNKLVVSGLQIQTKSDPEQIRVCQRCETVLEGMHDCLVTWGQHQDQKRRSKHCANSESVIPANEGPQTDMFKWLLWLVLFSTETATV